MVANFKAIAMEFGDLFPGHVIVLVRGKAEPFADEEGGAESKTLQDWANDSVVGGNRVIESKNDEFVRDRLERVRCRQRTKDECEMKKPLFHKEPQHFWEIGRFRQRFVGQISLSAPDSVNSGHLSPCYFGFQGNKGLRGVVFFVLSWCSFRRRFQDWPARCSGWMKADTAGLP